MRSSFMSEKHKIAKMRYSFYQSLDKNSLSAEQQELSYKDFLKSENPLDKYITRYEIDFEVSYKNEKREFTIPKQTMTIYTLNNFISDRDIEQKMSEAILNSTASKSGVGFSDGFKNALAQGKNGLNLNVTAKQIRGIEKSDNKKINSDVYENLKTNRNFYIPNIPEFKIKNKTGSTDMKLDEYYFN